MRTLKTLLAGLALILPAPACTYTGPAGAPKPEPAAVVEVTNNNWSDMVVFAARGGTRYRLGMVTSMQTARFPIPRTLALGTGAVELVADPVGSNQLFNTGPIVVMPGQTIDLTIQNNIRISSYAVWSR